MADDEEDDLREDEVEGDDEGQEDGEETSRRRAGLRSAARRPGLWLGLLGACLLGALGFFAGCTDWDPRQPFYRNAPDVDRAIELMGSGEPGSAVALLEGYLGTGACEKGNIGLPPAVRTKYNGSFDLGLALFQLAETYGGKFGEEEAGPGAAPGLPPGLSPGGPPADPKKEELRDSTIECALLVTTTIASDPEVPINLRAYAFYLAGNLEFLRQSYQEAVDNYDLALQLLPGVLPDPARPEDPDLDTMGSNAAWNRAIALRRQQEEEERQQEQQDQQDPEDDQNEDDQNKDNEDDQNKSNQDPDAGKDDQKGDPGEDDDKKEGDEGDEVEDDEESDDGDEEEKDADADEEEAGQSEQPLAKKEFDEDEAGKQAYGIDALLDEYEGAPTYQQEAAEKRANNARRRRVMEDK